jgi:hypothetical protein
VVTLTLLMSVPATAFLKFFARPLTWGQAFTISILCFAITTALVAVYYFVKATTGIASSVDGSATIAILILTGVLITRRARAYGIDKARWLGVGGKSGKVISRETRSGNTTTICDPAGRNVGRYTTNRWAGRGLRMM